VKAGRVSGFHLRQGTRYKKTNDLQLRSNRSKKCHADTSRSRANQRLGKRSGSVSRKGGKKGGTARARKERESIQEYKNTPGPSSPRPQHLPVYREKDLEKKSWKGPHSGLGLQKGASAVIKVRQRWLASSNEAKWASRGALEKKN